MAPPNDSDDARIRAQARRTQPVVLIDQQRRSTLPYGAIQPPPQPAVPANAPVRGAALLPGWQDQRTVSLRAPQTPTTPMARPGAPPLAPPPPVAQPYRPGMPPPVAQPYRPGAPVAQPYRPGAPVAPPPRPAAPPRVSALPPPAVPRAPAAPCRPSRPTPRVQAAPDGRVRQVHQRQEVIDALRAEISRLRRDK